MSRFNNLRDHLPSLYRPEDDDTSGEALPLSAVDILGINNSPPPSGSLVRSGLFIFVTLPEETVIESLELNPQAAAGSILMLELYHMADDLPFSRPTVVAPIQESVASVPVRFVAERFAILLKRPGLLSRFLGAIGSRLDQADVDASVVLQSHWFKFADSGLFSPYAARLRQLADPPEPAPHPSDPELDLFPYVRDLARLGALLAFPPIRDPAHLRETVEPYRDRIRRMVALYRDGLGTLDALRRIIEAQLPPQIIVSADEETPEERSQRLEQQDRAFSLEEYPRQPASLVAVTMPATHPEMVGPLMRWQLTNNGIKATAPTIYIQGVTPVPDDVDETRDPLIELYQSESTFPRVGISYTGLLEAGDTLRLSPSYGSWLGLEDGILHATSLTDPTAPGPWEAAAGAPGASITALLQTQDFSLWAGTADGSLWRTNGTDWTEIADGLPAVHCLFEDGQNLLIGTESGLQQLAMFTADPEPTPVTGVTDAVYVIHRGPDEAILLGTASGARTLTGDDLMTGIEIYAITHDDSGVLYFGTANGVLLYQPGFDQWYAYGGEGSSDQDTDWLPVTDGSGEGFLPAVRAIWRGRDAALWLGTENGLARYVAYAASRGRLTYTTQLEAFPDLVDGRVFSIREDERGLVWFATSRGLFRYDGRDLWQLQAGVWQQKGRADSLYGSRLEPEQRGAWRYVRAENQWQRFNPAGDWEDFSEDLRSTAEDPVQAVTWTDEISGDLGTWDGTTFTQASSVETESLGVRFKPDESTILDGGIPAVPRVPVGTSTWRYLRLETEEHVTFVDGLDKPAWSWEGRMFVPPVHDNDPPPGRFGPNVLLDPPHDHSFDEAVYAYNPAAQVWFAFGEYHLLGVLARVKKRSVSEVIDPAVLDRVQQGINRVRPASVRVSLAVEEEWVGG